MRVEIQNLVKKYKARTVLDIPELVIDSGGITGIRGHNGSGKSTLLDLIAQMKQPDSGTVLYDGVPMNAATQKRIGYVMQHNMLLKRSVLENIRYPLKLRGLQNEQRIEQLLDTLGLLPLAHQRADRLSGGEAQKVALARALVYEPELLLLDEPTASIDAQSVLQIESVIAAFQKQHGASIVMVTHHAEQAQRLCNRSIILREGRLHADEGSMGERD